MSRAEHSRRAGVAVNVVSEPVREAHRPEWRCLIRHSLAHGASHARGSFLIHQNPIKLMKVVLASSTEVRQILNKLTPIKVQMS